MSIPSHQRKLIQVCLETPSPSIPNSTISPSFKYLGGFKPIPTPSGVPVDIISPGNKVINLLM